jgi:hypothetical protein
LSSGKLYWKNIKKFHDWTAAARLTAYRYHRTATTAPKSDRTDGKKQKGEAMENIAHLFLIVGYGLLILKHFVGL